MTTHKGGRPKIDLSEGRWTVNTTELAHVIGIRAKDVSHYHRDGMPRAKPGRWHLPTCVQWMTERIRARSEGDPDIVEQRRLLMEAQEEKQRLDTAERLGDLIPLTKAIDVFAALTQLYVDYLESIPSRVEGDAELQARLEREVRAVRGDLADALRTARDAVGAPHHTNGAAS